MKKKHSGLGIASFVISIFVAGGTFLTIILAGVIEANSPGGMDEESTTAIIVGLMIIGMFFTNLLAFILGIAALFQGDRKKVFGILGIVICLMTGFGTIGLMILGTLFGG